MLEDKRIFIVFDSLELGGAERQALLLGRHLLHEQGAQVHVLAFWNPGRAAELCDTYEIPWRIVPLPWPFTQVQLVQVLIRFSYALRRAQPDVILPYTNFANLICGLTWRWSGARLCIWNQRVKGNNAPRSISERWAMRLTPCFISNSQHAADLLAQALEVKSTQIQVIYNGVELARPEADRATWRGRLGVDNDCFLACMVANLHQRKDHTTLLRAWRSVVDQLEKVNRSAVLLLAGRFSTTYKSLRTLAHDLELGRTVQFLGQIKDVSGLLSAVDLGVFVSPSEGCPNGVLECMASGLAIVGTDIPGIREAVGSGGYPFLVPLGDVEALADQILKLATDRELRLKVGAANRHRIKETFGARRMCEETVAFITRNLR